MDVWVSDSTRIQNTIPSVGMKGGSSVLPSGTRSLAHSGGERPDRDTGLPHLDLRIRSKLRG